MSDASLLREVAERTTQSRESAQLSRFDWLNCALNLFVGEGIDAVRITRLSDDLGVTRGSFYWHFQNREDLVDALLEFWKEKNSSGIVRSVGTANSLAEGILNLFESTINETLFDPKLDLAVREWARRSDQVRAMVDREDNIRIGALCEFFSRFGYAMPDALIRARVLYFSQIGFYALEVRESLETRIAYTESYFKCFTGKVLPKQVADENRRMILQKYGQSSS